MGMETCAPRGANGEALSAAGPVWRATGPATENSVSAISPLDADDVSRMKAAQKRRAHGVFQSEKSGKSLPWRNEAERDLMALLEVDPAVHSMEAWPEKVSIVLNGRESSWVPALRVQFADGPRTAILDAAETWDADKPWRRRLSRSLARIYGDRQIAYRFFAAREIRVQPRLRNAKAILERRGYPIDAASELLAIEALSVGARTIGEVGHIFPGGPDAARNTLYSMAIRGIVELDLSAAAAANMRVWLSGCPR